MMSRLYRSLLPAWVVAFAWFSTHCGGRDEAGTLAGPSSEVQQQCTPMTCSDLGKACGRWDDGCDGLVDCGGCATGQTCRADGQCTSGGGGGSTGNGGGGDPGDPQPCVPDCAGKCCGDDGCGNTCPNVCSYDHTCDGLTCGCVPVGACEGDNDGDGDPCDVDCDDANAEVGPSLTEVCDNGIDDDCNGFVDCVDPACTGDPACAACDPLEGVQDVCSLPNEPCICNNRCGQAVADDPQFITHFCYADCMPQQNNCPGTHDVCVAFDEPGTVFGCVPTGSVTMPWEAKILLEGAQPNPMSDMSFLTAPDATLAGNPVPLTMSVAGEATVGADTFVVLSFIGIEGQSALWQLQISIPKDSFVSGQTLTLDPENQQFSGALISAALAGQSVEALDLRGLVSGGSVTIDTATEAGSPQKSSGSLDIEILGLRAGLEVPQAY